MSIGTNISAKFEIRVVRRLRDHIGWKLKVLCKQIMHI